MRSASSMGEFESRWQVLGLRAVSCKSRGELKNCESSIDEVQYRSIFPMDTYGPAAAVRSLHATNTLTRAILLCRSKSLKKRQLRVCASATMLSPPDLFKCYLMNHKLDTVAIFKVAPLAGN